MYNSKAYSAAGAASALASATIARRDPIEHDVQIEILFCGVCHSDLHQVRNEWKDVMPTVYPCVPGHEIVGRVTRTGSAVTKFKPGDIAAVGCMAIPIAPAPSARLALSSSARTSRSPITSRTSASEASPTAAIPTALLSMSALSCGSLGTSISPEPRLFCAPESPHTHP